jgi:hypothetical protein
MITITVGIKCPEVHPRNQALCVTFEFDGNASDKVDVSYCKYLARQAMQRIGYPRNQYGMRVSKPEPSDLEQQSNHDAFQRAMSHEKPIIDPDPFGPLSWYDPNARG